MPVSVAAPTKDPRRRAARSAGLVYVDDQRAGYFRRRRGRGFIYVDTGGRLVRRPSVIERIRALAIPPAWESVWICAEECGHLQATGIDARGRKQYRYHVDWRCVRDATKYGRLRDFAQILPGLRRRVSRELKQRGLSRDQVIAAIVQLLDQGGLRIGNEAYVEANGSFGLTTLRNRHAQVRGMRLTLRFRGKGGFTQRFEIEHPRLARVVRRCSELPGQQLFEYLDAAGDVHAIGSADVNSRIQEWTGAPFTAKDFRTWRGSTAFLAAVRASPDGRRPLKECLEEVARTLGNTPAVCRKHYVHPMLIEQHLDGRLAGRIERASRFKPPRGFSAVEGVLVRLLSERQRCR